MMEAAAIPSATPTIPDQPGSPATATATPPDAVDALRRNVHAANARAVVVDAASPVEVDDPDALRGRRVLVVEDGPTLTHGQMRHGAGVAAARRFGAADLVDPRPWLRGALIDTFERYPHIGPLLPAMGYGPAQLRDLEQTIAAVDCDLVVVGTPIDLARHLTLTRPSVRVRYSLQCLGRPTLDDVVDRFLATREAQP